MIPRLSDRNGPTEHGAPAPPSRSSTAGLLIDRIDDGRLTVRAVGSFGHGDVEALSRRLAQLVSTGARSLRIDCSAVTELDGATVALLDRVTARLAANGRTLELTNPSPPTRAALDRRIPCSGPIDDVAPCRATGLRPIGEAADTTLVTFEAPAWAACAHAELLAEFVAWAPLAMDRRDDGRFTLAVRLDAGREWKYRFLFDGELLANDPAAPDYVELEDGSWISVIRT